MSERPQGSRQALIDKTIRDLKAAAIWNTLDIFYMLAAHDAQAARLNWKTPSTFALTAVNSPTFTADRGYAGDGSTSYLDTAWTPSTNAVNYAQDSACIGSYLNAGTDTAAALTAFGTAASPGARVRPRNTADTYNVKMNSSANETGGTSTTRLGLTCLDRAVSTTVTVYRNGSSALSQAETSSALPSTKFFICCGNDGAGGPSGALTNTVAFAFAGAALTSAQHSKLYEIVLYYLTAMGAQ